MTIADEPIQSAQAQPRYGWGGEQIDRSKAYRRARRHTLLVRVLRFLLPASGIAALAVLSLVSWVSAPVPYEITVADKYVSFDGIVMDRPTLTGYDKQNRRYKVSADKAIQKITNPNQVRLNDISAEVTLPDQGVATITAGGGDYDNSSATLKLIGGIRVDSTMGYQVSLKNAEIDLQAGTLVSRNPVTIRYQDSEITGDTMSVSDGGKRIVLEGRVESNLMPPKRDQQAQKSKAGSETGAGAAAAEPDTISDLIQRAEQ